MKLSLIHIYQYSDAEREQINQLADYQIKSYLELLDENGKLIEKI